MKKRAVLVILGMAMMLAVSGCGKKEADAAEDAREVVQEVDDSASIEDAELDEAPWEHVDATGTDAEIAKAYYSVIVQNLTLFATNVVNDDPDHKEYTAVDYMYYDYNKDDIKDIVLYLRYDKDDVNYMLGDICYLAYFPERKCVDVLGTIREENTDSSFYCDYKGEAMARYSWTTDPYASVLEVINVDEDNNLIYEVEQEYDEILVDYEDKGMKALPLYGYWEIVLPD